jgi:hypothetical protein
MLVLAEKRFLEKAVFTALPAWIREEMVECNVSLFREVIPTWK